jgi:hypothetical protein
MISNSKTEEKKPKIDENIDIETLMNVHHKWFNENFPQFAKLPTTM